MQATVTAASALRARLSFLWDTTEFDADYRRALQATLAALLAPAARAKERDDGASPLLLPFLCCDALGGESEGAVAVNAAWALLYAAFYLLDKVEDQEPIPPPTPALATGTLLNVTTGLMLGAELLLAGLEAEGGIGADATRDVRTRFSRLALVVCGGQHRDLTLTEPGLQEAWQVAAAKSGSFFALGGYVGARAATGDEALLAAYASFGRHLGIQIQIANDIDGLWGDGDCPSDLARGQWSLPVAYAFHALPSAKQVLLRTLLDAAVEEDGRAEAEARRLILDCGALIYLALEAEKQKRQAENVLRSAHGRPEATERLVALLRGVAVLKQEQ